jgi:FkbM family methyltransferase
VTRGKGWIFRCLRSWLATPRTIFEIEPGVYIEANLDDYLGRHYFLYGLGWQPSFVLSLRVLRPEVHSIDVGANVGFWLLGAASRLGHTGRAHALEPSPDLLAGLLRNVHLNALTNVTCHQVAASDHDGEGAFVPRPENTALGGLTAAKADPNAISVRLTTLDALVERHGLSRVDFLKIDVEGAEEAVLRGATAILAAEASPMLLIEIGGPQAALHGSSPERIKATLATYGYETYRLHGGRLRQVARADAHPTTEDVFALKPSHFATHALLAHLLTGRHR